MKTNTITTVYKVLTRSNKQLFSINKDYCMPNLAQRYFTNRRNYPKFAGSKLFAFKTFEEAKDLQATFGGVIYECEASVSSLRISHRINGFEPPSKKTINSFWKNVMKGIPAGVSMVPTGNVLCNWIEIIGKAK